MELWSVSFWLVLFETTALIFTGFMWWLAGQERNLARKRMFTTEMRLMEMQIRQALSSGYAQSLVAMSVPSPKTTKKTKKAA